MAEIIYSGGWVGVVLAFLAVLYYRSQLRKDTEFVRLSLFTLASGLGLWILQGSNLLTGKLTETGEHVRMLILPWLVFSTISIGVFLWKQRAQLSQGLKVFSITVLLVLSVANVHYTYYHLSPFFKIEGNRDAWQAQQLYAKPLAWLDSQQKEPVVVWSDPHSPLSAVLPLYTRDYTLDSYWGMLELVPEGEIRERYLISQYFNSPTLADLKSEAEMGLYLGRGDLFHTPATHNREVKLCRILFFWDKHKDCGAFTTTHEMLGENFFSTLENKFQKDIKPNVKAYLQKYHVSYIMKDKVLDPEYRPEVLGAKLVYTDERYEIYRLP